MAEITQEQREQWKREEEACAKMAQIMFKTWDYEELRDVIINELDKVYEEAQKEWSEGYEHPLADDDPRPSDYAIERLENEITPGLRKAVGNFFRWLDQGQEK